MPPTGAWYSIWAEADYDSPDLMLDCLLPTGIIVPLRVQKAAQIKSIKDALWIEARKYPLYSLLNCNADYVFVCINEMAVKVELEDETKRLCDVRPFQPMLKLVEKQKNDEGIRQEKALEAQISALVGKRVDALAAIESAEVVDFRRHMRDFCERIARERDGQEWLQRALCFYPPDVMLDPKLPSHLQRHLDENAMTLVLVHVENADATYTLQVAVESTRPEDLVEAALRKRFATTGKQATDASDFVLKVCGRDEYFLGDYPLSQFKYVRKMMSKGVKPELLVVRKELILDETKPIVPPRPGPGTRPAVRGRPPVDESQAAGGDSVIFRNHGHCLYDCMDFFAITLVSVSNVGMQDSSMVNVRACLYHGPETLSADINSPERRITEGSTIQWNEPIGFNVILQNLPRMTRLCFMLYTSGDRRSNPSRRVDKAGASSNRSGARKDEIPIAWVNIPIFDYKGNLRSGEHKLYMWPVTDEDILSDARLNPIGTVESNPQLSEAACLTVNFHRYNLKGPIFYPPFDKVLEVAAKFINMPSDGTSLDAFRDLVLDPRKVTPELLDQLRKKIECDPLDVPLEQDKELIWSLRHECCEYFPRSLPKVLACVHWDNYIEVALMQMLLQIWRPLPPTDALLLLDFEYADKSVRKFAVECLKEMSDSELSQYLLQFIQVLKYESYLECDLIEFLLRRSLMNQKIGIQLFWLLRSEMHIPSVSVRFGLILEAYCRGNILHLNPVTKQHEAVRRLGVLADIIKKLSLPKETLKEEMKKILQNPVYQDALTMIGCPLDAGLKLNQLEVKSCKSMDSKMRPLWLVWKNADSLCGAGDGKISIMYKKGDDLRQDMLSLQILRIMDNFWQMEGLDLRLNAYGCLSTGHDEGLIEVVTDANTIANIQKDYPGVVVKKAFNKLCLYDWLKLCNQTEESFEKALEEFLLSCAGYCVATYVLGVADRHSDNIMLRKNGQLFHIDFGHILGHFKSKLGVRRERVPFVLTSDFVYVIRRGKKQDDKNFNRFTEICEKAYLILRKHSNFLITLFLMMMNTGIPEVSCIKDIEYLKETLVPHKTDEEAIAHFRSHFQEALHYGWKVNLNNVFHLVRVGAN